MQITRSIEVPLTTLAQKIGVLSIMGPRQSGKTTLVQKCFPQHRYFNLEDLSLRERIAQDPKGFIFNQESGIILDEVQKYPELLSYVQLAIDEAFSPARFVLTGSENLLLSANVSQSLAGRVAIFHLLPLSVGELAESNSLRENVYEQLLYGFYPRVYHQSLKPADFYSDYAVTYVERDVRQVQNIGDLSNFQRFLRLLAGRTGQILNLSSLGNDVGVTYKTIDAWLSILESTYIAFRLEPYHENFGKRIIKSPKVYFYDTGLLCHLLGIDTSLELSTHSAIGALFETMVVADIKKQLFNTRSSSNLYFWRDSERNEVDLIIDTGGAKTVVEIKVGSTFSSDYLKGIRVWNGLQSVADTSYVVYTGEHQLAGQTRLLPWQSISELGQSSNSQSTS